VTYQIVVNNRNFVMNGSSLILKNTLDYETAKRHYFKVQASVSMYFGAVVTSEVGILVIVTDVNDVPPRVVPQNIITVSDTSIAGQPIGLVKVNDPDTQNTISYSVIGSYPFSITGDGYVVVNGDLNSRAGELIVLNFRVSDGKHEVTSSMSIQVHQTKYTASLNENATPGTVIATLTGINTNSFYSLANTYGVFAINSTTGVITLTNSVDYETRKTYDINVVDSLRRNVAHIRLALTDINDNKPTFTPISPVTLNEFSALKTQVLQVKAEDLDSTGQVTYSLTGGNNFFAIDRLTGVITLEKALFSSQTNSFVVNVKAEDDAGFTDQTAITFNVNRISSNTLGCISFSSGGVPNELRISESASIGSVLGSVSANTGTKASSLTYSLDSTSNSTFAISRDGKLSLRKMLDYETAKIHLILVTATDTLRKTSSTWTLVVNVLNTNEHAPVLTATSFTVQENAVVGAYVGRIYAKDVDTVSIMTFYIKSGNNDNKFMINSQTGVVTTNGGLNALGMNKYDLQICVNDTVHSVCQYVVVTVTNVNDGAPSFNVLEKRVGLQSDATVGTILFLVQAADIKDEDTLTYTIDSGNSIVNSMFAIDSNTGVVILKTASPSADSYVFLVCASDGKFKTCIPVTVTVAAIAADVPTFQIPVYAATVTTLTANDTILIRIRAEDTSQAVLEYTIVNGDTNIFSIGRFNGHVTLKNRNALVGGKVYSLNVSATNQATKRIGFTSILIASIKNETAPSSFIKSVNGTKMTVDFNLGTFDQSKSAYYLLIAQEFSPDMDPMNNNLPAVSYYYVINFPEYQYRRFYIANVSQAALNGIKKRTRREVTVAKTDNFEYVAGNEDCSDPKYQTQNAICNGKLKEGTLYRYGIQCVYTNGKVVANVPVTQLPTSAKRTASPTQSATANSSDILYWIIGVVVLGILFWLALLAIAILLCYKRRYTPIDEHDSVPQPVTTVTDPPTHKEKVKMYRPTAYYQEVDLKQDEVGDDDSPLPTNDEAVKVKELPAEPEASTYDTTLTLTHSMVMLENLEGEPESPRQSPVQEPKEYDTISQSMKFGEDKNDWENMDIKLTIDPTGQRDPVITKAEADPVDESYPSPPPSHSNNSSEEYVERKTITTTVSYDEHGNVISENRTEENS